jgi:hypothetical protein
MSRLPEVDEDADSEHSSVSRKNFNKNVSRPAGTYAYTPLEILSDLDDFKLCQRVDRDKDYFFPITFKGKVCHIETPKCLFMFGLSSFRNPGGRFDKYCINLSLREICREAPDGHNVTNFKYCLENIDLFACCDIIDDPKFKWFSAILKNHASEKKPPVLRVKVPSDAQRLKITIVKDGKENYYPLVSEFNELFQHRSEVKCILEVNPVWYAYTKDKEGKEIIKYGISYKLIKIQLADSGRRSVQFRP